MRVLITGGAGWIGEATCRYLRIRGHDPVIFDRAHGGNVLDQEAVFNAVEGSDHVIHLAGLLGTHELFATPHAAVEVNVLGSLNITHECAQQNVGLTEITMPRVNPSLYAATKACAMDIALAYQQAGRLRCSFVRAYNAYGPGQAYGEGHPTKILPTFASKAWAGEDLPVWGHGQLLTDLVHVDDVARMLVEAMAFGDGEVFDAGTGYGQTVEEVAHLVIDHVWEVCGLSVGIEHLPARKGERKSSTGGDVASGENWSLLGGWRPVFDPIRFAEAIDSYRP